MTIKYFGGSSCGTADRHLPIVHRVKPLIVRAKEMRTSRWYRLLTLSAASTNRALVRHVEHVKEENRILRARTP
ncbi:MAG: hypothetical protein CMJ48_04370 [Planctomycetaceae bacterium]|nr:hypothetical protein [Planctomycetaceae bacterium]